MLTGTSLQTRPCFVCFCPFFSVQHLEGQYRTDVGWGHLFRLWGWRVCVSGRLLMSAGAF